MKQILLSLVLLFCVGSAFGQTVEKLIAKYKALPGAVYENTTKQSFKDLKGLNSILSANEIAKLKKHFKKSEQVQIQNISEDQLERINKDIKALKNHELLFETIRNAGSESLGDSANTIKKMFADVLNPSVKMQCYGKVDGKMVSDLLIRVDVWNTVVLGYIDAQIDRDIWMKALENSKIAANDDDEAKMKEGKEAKESMESLFDGIGNIADMKDVLKDAENDDVLIVINGKEHPELHSTKDAAEYMKEHNIWFNNESWIVGDAVKEKYPKTNKKVVIEFSRNDKKVSNINKEIEFKFSQDDKEQE